MADEFAFIDELKPLGVPDKTTPGADDYSFISDIKAQETNARNAALRQAVPVNPDTAAKEKNIAAQTGVPLSVVTGDKGDLADQARVNEINRILTASPILARQMADPEFAKLAHDDTENLSLTEKVMGWWRNDLPNVPGKNLAAVAKSVHDMNAGLWSFGAEMPADLVSRYITGPIMGSLDPFPNVSRFAREQRHAEENVAKEISDYWGLNDKQSYIATQYYQALGSVWQSLATLPVGIEQALGKAGTALTGNLLTRAFQASTEVPLTPMIPMMASQGGQSYGKDVDQGAHPLAAAGHAVSDAMIEGLTEKIALGRFVHDMKVGDPLWKMIRNQVITENAGEQVATHMEDLNAWAVTPENKDKTFGDYLHDRPAAALDTLVQTTMATIMQTGVMGLAANHARSQGQKQAAEQNSAVMQKLFEIAKDDELRRRAPVDFGTFVQKAAEEHGSGHVYIDAATFAQAAQEHGLDIAATMPETAAQMKEAIAMKTDVRIPVGEATTALPGTGLEQTLFQEMRMSPDAPTLKETQDKANNEATQKAVEAVMADQNFKEAISTSRMAVENEFLKMHEAAGRFTTDVNKVYAKMDAAFIATMGARVGLTPEEMYVKYGREIKSKLEKFHGENVMKQTVMEKRVADFLAANPVPKEAEVAPEDRAAVEPNIKPILEAAEKNRPAFNKTVKKIARGLGHVSRAAGVKKMDRSVEKVVKEYGGQHEKLLDALRSTITVDSPADAAAVIDAIRDNFYVVPGRIKDRFTSPTPTGYSDVLINVRLPDGSYGEIQIVTPEMAAAKKLAHDLYKVYRSVPEGHVLRAETLALQREIYAEAKASNSSRVMNVPSLSALTGLGKAVPSGRKSTSSESIATGEPSTSRNLAEGGNSIDSNLAQAKGGVYDQETIDNDTGALDEKPPFYSVLSMLVAAAKMNNAPAAQWKSFINSLANKGVKKEEISMSGVLDWLDTIGKPTPAELDAAKYSALRNKGTILPNAAEKAGAIVSGMPLFGWLTHESYGGLLPMPALTVADAILAARDTARIGQSVNWRDAKINVLQALGIRTDERVADLNTGDALAIRAVDVLKDLDAAGEFRFDDQKPAEQSTAVVPAEPQPAPPAKKPDTRVSKQMVIDYLASDQNPVRPENVKTMILGGTEAEQEGAKKPAATTAVSRPMISDRLPDGFTAASTEDGYHVTAPDGTTQTFMDAMQAITGSEAWMEEQKNLPSLPDDYDYKINDEGQYVVTYEPDEEEIHGSPFDTRQEAMEAINEHYEQHEGAAPEEPDDSWVEQRADELIAEDADDIANSYARDSDYVNVSLNVALLPPTYRIEKVEGSGGIADLFTGRETKEHYRVVTLEFADLPGEDEVDDQASGNERERKNMPDDAEEFWQMYGKQEEDNEGPKEEMIGPEFATEAEAKSWAEGNVPGGAHLEPKWVPWEGGESSGPEDAYYGRHDSFQDAHRAAEGAREQRYEGEVEQIKENIDEYVDRDRYLRKAREEWDGENESQTYWTNGDIDRAVRVSGWNQPRPRYTPRNALALQHENSYQSDGGRDYRELPTYIPGIEPYNAHDSTHFGDRSGGRTVVWTRIKIHDSTDGVPTLFIEEDQSQRGQAGNEVGFKYTRSAEENTRIKSNVARSDQLWAEMTALAEDHMAISARDAVGFFDQVPPGTTSLDVMADQKGWDAEQKASAEKYIKLRDERNALNEEVNAINTKSNGSVPTAPFVTDTKAWAALGLKRALRWAVDQGLTRVAWTVGGENALRYHTQDQIDTLGWRKEEGGVTLIGIKDGKTVLNKRIDGLEGTLVQHVGSKNAQNIIDDPAQSGELSAKTLDAINGLGMQAFYGDKNGVGPTGKPSIMAIVGNQVLKDLGSDQKVREMPVNTTEKGQAFNGAPGFEITPAMAAKIKGGQKLFQQNRGQISFGSDIKTQKSVITLLENADLSTYIHESGHFYLEVLADMASQPDAPLDVQADMQRILDWFGIPTLASWNEMKLEDKRPYHERFARGFERYIFEGKAPSIELAGMFSRFRAWMLNVYREITKLNVEVTDEVRGVFDRMLASNDEILQAEAARSYAPLFKTAEEMGATADEWKAYQDQHQEATQEAVNTLESRALRDMKWLSNAKSRVLKKLQKQADAKRKAVRSEVEKEVRQTPVYAAIRFLTHGEMDAQGRTNRERKIIEAFAGMKAKLSIPALKEMYGDGPAAPWRYLNAGKYGTIAAEDGLDPNMVAELFGFTSGDHLVKEILAAEPEDELIDAMTDKRMLERYGDMTNPQVIEEAANAAIHNDLRAKFLATELRALAKATGQKNILIKAAKEFAATIIDRKKIEDIRPSQYTAAEARAGRNAEKASNIVEKATEKRNQIVNHYAAKAAYDALDYVEKNVAYLRKIGDSKTIDADYIEQIQALLDRFELRRLTLKDKARRESLLAWMEEQVDKGFEPVIDAELVNEAKRVPYTSLPLEEFRGLVDAVKNIEHLGRLKHKLLTVQKDREFAAIVAEAAQSVTDNAKRTIKAPLEHNTWTDKMKSGVAQFFAWHRKFASMIREMDGYNDNGVLTKLFLHGMNAAGDTEASMREDATKKLTALLKPVLKEGKMGQKLYIPAINASLSREGRIMVALNMGTEGNLQRLLDGDNWTPDQAKAVLDTLTKTEMDFVQGVWDFIEGFKDEIGAQQRRITGVAPEWVEPRPLQTKHGEYAGGYIPAKYDTTRSTRSLSDEAAVGIMDQWRAKRGAAKTRDSFTKARAKKVVDRPLRKDFGVITQHVTEVTHRLAWQEYLIDAQRLLRSGKLDTAIRDHYGPEVLEAMRNTIEDVAAGEVGAQNAFEQGVNYLRTGATIAGLGWRLTTAMLQPIGLTQSIVRIGPKYVGRGLAQWIGNSARMESTAEKIYEKSSFMRLRGKTMQREISEIRNVVAGKNSAIEASYFYLIQKMQLVADIPAWLGQYEKAVENGADEKTAVAQADQAVIDAQGSGMIKDLAGAQRGGPMMKLFTNFYSFFNTTYNLTSEVAGRAKLSSPTSVAKAVFDLLMLYSVPAALGTLMKAALHSGDDGADDWDKLLRQLIADQITYLFGTMVGLRELAGTVQTVAGLPGDYQGPASVRAFAEIAKLGQQIHQGEADEAFWKALNNTAGILFHYPAGQISSTVDGIVTMGSGHTSNPGALIVGSNKK